MKTLELTKQIDNKINEFKKELIDFVKKNESNTKNTETIKISRGLKKSESVLLHSLQSFNNRRVLRGKPSPTIEEYLAYKKTPKSKNWDLNSKYAIYARTAQKRKEPYVDFEQWKKEIYAE